MAKRTKYLIAAAVTVVVVAIAIGAAVTVGLLAGALVLLVALVATLLAVRYRVSKQEKAASADWVDAIGDATIPEEDLQTWTPSPARSGRMIADPSVFATPSEATDLAPTRETATEGFEGLTDEALAVDDPEDAWPAAGSTDTIDWSVPSEWGQGPIADESSDDEGSDDEAAAAGEGADAAILPFTSVPSGDDLDGATDDDPGDPSDVSAAPGDARLDEEPPHADEPDGAADLGPTAPGTDPAPIDEPAGIPDLEPTPSLTYASAGAATNGQRRGTIDWTGPVHTVDEHVHTADDILEASAATALPTDTDRPAPATGSELARLLAKVEARLRDYD